MKASVIVSIYNNFDDLPALVQSLQQQELEGHEMEVIVRDDGSQDRGAEWIEANHQWIKLIKGSNAGFSRSNNIAAQSAGGDVLVFVNADTILDSGFISAGLEVLGENPQAGGVNSNMIMPWVLAPEMFQHGERPDTSYEFRLTPWGYALYGQCPTMLRKTDFLSGGGCFVRKSALDGDQPFTEQLWGKTSYCEDLELALRIFANGWSLLYAPHAVIYHNQRRVNSLRHKEFIKFIKVSLNRFKVYATMLTRPSFMRLLLDLLAGIPRKIESLDLAGKHRRLAVICGWLIVPLTASLFPLWFYLNHIQGYRKRVCFRNLFVSDHELCDLT